MACLLAAGALRLRFFGLTVGAALVLLAPVSTPIFYFTVWQDMLSMGGELHIATWDFSYLPAGIGAMLITSHFFAPVKAIPSEETEDTGDGEHESAETATDISDAEEEYRRPGPPSHAGLPSGSKVRTS